MRRDTRSLRLLRLGQFSDGTADAGASGQLALGTDGPEQPEPEPVPAPAPPAPPGEPVPFAEGTEPEDGGEQPPEGAEVVAPEGADAPVVVADAGDGTDTTDLGDERWHAVVIVEGVRTNDGREIASGALSLRPPPLPLQFTTKTTWGHDGADHGGSIESLSRDPQLAQDLADAGFISLADGAVLLVAEGSYDQTDDGQHLRGMVNRQELRFVSADLEILAAEEVYPLDGEDAGPMGGTLRVTSGSVMGATVCPFPAFQQCVIAPISMSLFDAATQGFDAQATTEISNDPSPVAIAASGGPEIPPAEWYENPRFGANDVEDTRLVEDPDHPGRYYCPFTLLPDGRVYAHAAAWHREHIGMLGHRVRPPKSNTNYAYFCNGTVVVMRDGADDVIRCGVLTMNTGHAVTSGPAASAASAKRHYDDTGTQVATLEMGEDRHGIWIAGSINHNVPEDQIRALRAGGLSGDWRPQGNGSEMVALLAVNVPGFPLPRPARSYQVVNDEQRDLVLVAAGFVPARDPVMERIQHEVRAQLAVRLDPILDQLTPLLLEQLDARLSG